MRVLVVDSNMAIQEILFDILTMSGQKAGTVGSIDDAEKCLTRFKPEAIFLDASLCNGDRSFLDAVDRDLAENPPKIFMLVKDDIPQEFTSDGCIQKPFKSTDIIEIISKLEGKEKELLFKELSERLERPNAPNDDDPSD
jgi:DNA-binding response OmpR family regulator